MVGARVFLAIATFDPTGAEQAFGLTTDGDFLHLHPSASSLGVQSANVAEDKTEAVLEGGRRGDHGAEERQLVS
jgi:hypothetical protein